MGRQRKEQALRGAGARLRAKSAAEAIYDDLRAEIVSLERPPGEPLIESEITVAYGVSRTPVREAILRLAGEGLVEIFPQSGTFVARIPIASLPEALTIRKALEEMTARLAAERASRGDIGALRAIIRKQRELSAAGNRDAFHRADEAFHAAIADAAGHPGIWKLVQQIKVQVDRYRRVTLPQKGRMIRVVREHTAIAAAIEARVPARAALKMSAHLDALMADIPDIRRSRPDFFFDGAREAGGAGGRSKNKRRLPGGAEKVESQRANFVR
ncbi:MAG TPA: GntR family transcriptional regulator [Xanthobacteraceae bacterium]|nr:GntR family transcriptional regulator [Xanthobacteraceae bacterium]